ncbi:hypothetical protein FD754_025501, partial [Muntiacus muntjak]
LLCPGCHALLQGIFLTQGSNLALLCLLHWQTGSLLLYLSDNTDNSGVWNGEGLRYLPLTFTTIAGHLLIFSLDLYVSYLGYTGVRCEHFFLTVQKPLSKEYVALTVILVILFLVIVAGSIYYFCR